MSEPENFLSRWSRRKREAEQASEPAATSADPRDPPTHKDSAGQNESAETLAKAESRDPGPHNETAPAHEEEPAFDLSTLPSLESITAETDIRVFMQKGVPAELMRAALRRAWAADPTIRDFIEIAENQWDFVTGSDLPGFGPLEASPEELRRMVADLFGEGPKATNEIETKAVTADSGREMLGGQQLSTAAENPQQAERQEVAIVSQDQSNDGTAPAVSSASIVQSNSVNIASQQNNTDEEYRPLPTRRFHGRALPQ